MSTQTKPNPDAQLRAGRNMPNILGTFSGIATKSYRLTQQETVIAEGQDPSLIPGGFTLISSTDLAYVLNHTGGSIDATLYLESPDGDRITMPGTPVTILDGATDNLVAQLFLPEGFKYILEISNGNINQGSGVHVVVTVTATAPNGTTRLTTSKVTNAQIDLYPVPGVNAVLDGVALINFSNVNAPYDAYYVFEEDGFEYPIYSGAAAPGGVSSFSPNIVVGGGSFVRIKFTSAPQNMHLQQAQIFRTNDFPFDPAI